MLVRFAVAVASLLLLCTLNASAEDFIDDATRIRFPDAIAIVAGEPAPAHCTTGSRAFCRGPVDRYPDSRLGIGLSYAVAGNVAVASVFIYDLGQSGSPDGPASRIVETQYEAMKGEIRSMETLANYRNVRLLSEDAGDTLAAIGPLKARAAHFSYERDGRPYLSDAYLSALNGKLLKVRVTYRADLAGTKNLSEAFMAELGARVAEALGSRAVELEDRPAGTNRRRS
jgi:hypothetical protein